MAQVTEPRGQHRRRLNPRSRMSFSTSRGAIGCRVTIHLMDGRQLDARIKNFDQFAVVVEVGGRIS